MADGSPLARSSLEGLEAKWLRRWQEEATYAFDRSGDRSRVYAIDTPPPTVSGNLHVGSVFSFTHTDIVARFQRMRGKAVFYPMGWDDNGLPTERRVQNVYGVRCDPALPYDPSFVAPERAFDPPRPVSRRNFIELCTRLTRADEAAFERLWRRLGLSVDWSYTYTTIGPVARTVAQRAFLRNLARGEAYLAQAPTLWDTGLRTAVAQAEVVDREEPGAYHRLRFTGPGGTRVEIETTRPELLPACVALVAHPSDTRYAGLVGKTVHSPLFHVDIQVYAHPLADPAKGTGLAMVCTFGDLADVTWWRELALPSRVVVGRDGRLAAQPPPGMPADRYARLAGRTVKQARRIVVELLRGTGELVGEPRPISHAVKYYEKGDAPLEIVASRQWYLRNGGRDADLRERLIERGRALRWVPEHMRHRYEHWVTGLTGDWLISRQRFFGVPIPVWYPFSPTGEPDYDHPLVPDESRLPVDPAAEAPDGYAEHQRGEPGGFIADPDVFDTWATSSLSPQIAGGWCRDEDLFARVFPMDLRPQGHDIIRTWLFATVLRADLEQHTLPWHTAVISGWILDPDRKKMGKSTGNATTPEALLERYGSDAVRYWSACGRPGVDTAFAEDQMTVGRRLATKVLNASRFVLGLGGAGADAGAGAAGAVGADAGGAGAVSEPLDLGMLAALSTVVDEATAALERYDHTAALGAAEGFFWSFCDDYIELVKERAYGDGGAAASARAALALALSVQLRLFAPFLPFVTEEVWSWWRPGSVHLAAWPAAAELPAGGDPAMLAAVGGALGALRRYKSGRRMSMKTPLPVVEVGAPAGQLARLRRAESDLRDAAHIGELRLVEAAQLSTSVLAGV